MPQAHSKTIKTTTESTENGHAAAARTPSEQALEVVDVTFGAMPLVAEVVRETVVKLRDPSTRNQELETLQRRVNTLRDPQTRDTELESLRKTLTAEIEKAKVEGPRIRKQTTKQLVDQAKKARKSVEPVEQRVRELV